VRAADERHRVTTFELFFDLVYVFAVTQVTAYMAHAGSGAGVVQGVLLLGLLWWTWCAYSWLGNQAHADEGLTRLAMAAAMAAIFVVGLTIPESWEDAPGGLNGPVVLVCAYLFVRILHLGVYAVAAAGDRGLLHQLLVTVAPMLAGASGLPISASLMAGAVLGIVVSLFLWWLYFDVVSRAAEHVFAQLTGRAQATLAVEAYSYLHFPLVAGVVLTALGVEEVLAHVGETDPLGRFAALALHGGLALYLLGHVAFKRRLHGTVSAPRLATAAVLALAAPLSAELPPLAALALVVAVLGTLVAVETARYAPLRADLRQKHV
jgi:low temperature requirement protein LtrA